MEYETVDVKDWLKPLKSVIQEYANDGWELVQVLPLGPNYEWRVILKKPKVT